MDEIVVKIVKHLGKMKEYASGWSKELNIVSWNSHEPKFDIREWNKNHTQMTRGTTLTPDEMERMMQFYVKYRTDEMEQEKDNEKIEQN